MNNLQKFNKVYDNIKTRLLFEDSTLSNQKYNFKKDEDGNIICMFNAVRNQEMFVIMAKYFSNEFSFSITDENGNTKDYSERKFIINFNEEYKEFKDAFDSFMKNQDEEDESTKFDPEKEGENIESFDRQLKNEEEYDENVKYVKKIKIDNYNFIFKMLNDQAVDNYCECNFRFQNTESNEQEIYYYRCLIDIKKANSLIIKMLKISENDEILGTEGITDFKIAYPKMYEVLMKAIKKMEFFVTNK